MIQQDHLQIFDLTLNVWAPLFVGNGSSYTKKEYMYNTRNGKVSSYYKVVVIRVPLQGQNATIDKVLWIG